MAVSGVLVAGFILIPLTMCLALVAGVAAAGRGREAPETTRRWTLATAAASALWLLGTWAVAARGTIRRFDATPPPLGILLLTILALGLAVGLSPLGTRLVRGLPLSVLVGAQAFRFPLELLMHRAYEERIMPVQ